MWLYDGDDTRNALELNFVFLRVAKDTYIGPAGEYHTTTTPLRQALQETLHSHHNGRVGNRPYSNTPRPGTLHPRRGATEHSRETSTPLGACNRQACASGRPDSLPPCPSLSFSPPPALKFRVQSFEGPARTAHAIPSHVHRHISARSNTPGQFSHFIHPLYSVLACTGNEASPRPTFINSLPAGVELVPHLRLRCTSCFRPCSVSRSHGGIIRS